jgi:hypothetical protein
VSGICECLGYVSMGYASVWVMRVSGICECLGYVSVWDM